MFAYLSTHLMQLIVMWATANALLSAVSSQVPPTSTAGKLLHVLVAFGPLDVLKAWKAIGAQAIPPMAFLLVLFGCGCKSQPPPVTPNVQAAEQAEHSAADALAACAATAGLRDKLAGDNWEQVTLDEISSCGADAVALILATVKLHNAERQALTVLQAAGAADAGAVDPTTGKPK